VFTPWRATLMQKHARPMANEAPRAHVRRVLRASAADIFSAWTTPSDMAHWMTPAGSASAEVDLRVGGRFRLVMADEHLSIEHTGEYRVIEPPHLLVFTWRSEFTGMRDTLVTVRLTARSANETELDVTHELASDEQATSHAGGWSQLVSRLESYLRTESQSEKA
jgi:uncharacterized protein YndB with AHSA1/START domain